MSHLHNPNSAQRLKRLNHRQRKKMRVGEYRELGFHLIATIAKEVDTDTLLDDWLNCVDDAAISFGGHFDGNEKLEGVVFPVGDVAITEEIRAKLLAWLQERSEVTHVEAGDLIDLWHTA